MKVLEVIGNNDRATNEIACRRFNKARSNCLLPIDKRLIMTGQMCWLPGLGQNGNLILHLREHDRGGWQPYTFYAKYAVPDYKVPGGSKGWATYQKLSRAGWKLMPTEPEINNFSSNLAVAAAANR